MSKCKTIIAVFIMIAMMTLPIMALPAHAQAAPTQKTYAIGDVLPNPTGVGQSVLVRFGVLEQQGAALLGWTGITVTVVKPDNTTETLGPFKTDSTGSSFTSYTPTQVGTYRFTTNFPQQTNTEGYFSYEGGNFIAAGTVMLASTSTPFNLTVEQQQRPIRPGANLPTEYWSRPIDAQNREWYSISGNWVGVPDANNNYWVSNGLYNDAAPETAHVLWAQQLTTGGLTGGLLGDGQVPAASESGDAYEGKFSGSIILNGILYYTRTDPGTQSTLFAVDLHTGETLWTSNNISLSFGQIFYFNSYNVDGVYTYLWQETSTTNPDLSSNTTWTAFDPIDGNQQMQIKNIPSGTRTYGPSGEILIYQIDYAHKWLALWNSTDCGLQNAVIGTPDYGSWGNTAHGNALGPGLDGANPRCYTWNVSIPAGLSAGTSFFAPIMVIRPDRIMSMVFNLTQVEVWAISTAAGSRGQLLFDQKWQAPAEWLAGTNTLNYVGASTEVTNGVIAIWDKELTTIYGFSMETGKYLWATASEAWQDAYGWGNAEHTWYFAYGHLYSVGIGGIVYAYNLATGATDWTYVMSDAYNEPVTGNNWWGWFDVITAGKIYVGTLEHSAENPIPRGGPYICLNATTGEEIWRVNGMFRETRWGGNGIIGDSIIATMDTYDQRVYAIGKGPSETTVTASPKVTTSSNSVLVEGYVTDNSPGTKTDALTLRFPNGVAAVSDASMSDWMLYVYKQFSRPQNATGVLVDISVLDGNNNYRSIGTTTSDSDGHFSFQWKPDITGKYTVIATFAGSKAYYGSYAETSFAVDAAAPTASSSPVAEKSTADLYFIPAIAGLFILIIVVAIVLAMLMLRKRP
jgi:outer membrane protein assembly factor BamB